jgi:hypothetical protein
MVLASPDPTGLSPAARRALSGVWAFRANAEREAEQRFGRLVGELTLMGAPAEAIQLATRAVVDEQRHVELCEALASSYRLAGGVAPAFPPTDASPLGPRELDARDRLLYEVVAFCCVTETLNSSLMKVARDRASVPEAREALRTILRDEVGHARIGWAHLAHEASRRRCGFLDEMLPRMLAGAIRDELFSPGPAHPDEVALERHGELAERVRLEIFESALRDIIAPGLEGFGVDTRPLWRFVEKRRTKGKVSKESLLDAES